MGLIRFAPALLLVVGLLHPVSAAAQAVGTGTIAGTVRDASGVLRGVTVEATSPALIEGSRSVTTDDAGRYSIVNLRPGTYTVTFTLSGFSSAKREGVELTSDFTANVNSELTVGAVKETVTVQSRPPVVDVQASDGEGVRATCSTRFPPTGRRTRSCSRSGTRRGVSVCSPSGGRQTH
jgi:hypothetical protein